MTGITLLVVLRDRCSIIWDFYKDKTALFMHSWWHTWEALFKSQSSCTAQRLHTCGWPWKGCGKSASQDILRYHPQRCIWKNTQKYKIQQIYNLDIKTIIGFAVVCTHAKITCANRFVLPKQNLPLFTVWLKNDNAFPIHWQLTPTYNTWMNKAPGKKLGAV